MKPSTSVQTHPRVADADRLRGYSNSPLEHSRQKVITPSGNSTAIARLKQRLAPTSLATLLWLTGGWLVTQVSLPDAAHAYTATVNVALDVKAGESYEVLVRRAETVARAAAQRSFDRDILATEVSVVVTAQNESTIVPILTLEATRNQWRGRPDPRRWATYFRSSKSLLGLGGAQQPATATAPAAPAATPDRTPVQPAAPSAAPGQPTPGLPSLPGATPGQLPGSAATPGQGTGTTSTPGQGTTSTPGQGTGTTSTPGLGTGGTTSTPGLGTGTTSTPEQGTTSTPGQGTGTTGTSTTPGLGTGTTSTPGQGTGTTGTSTSPTGTGTTSGQGTPTAPRQLVPVNQLPPGTTIINPGQSTTSPGTGTSPSGTTTSPTGTTTR